jgi:uncharacterized membrane protein YphA (DoxX/SURF4 family)
MPFDAEAARAGADDAPRPPGFCGGVMAGLSLLLRYQLAAVFLFAAWQKLKWAPGRDAAGPQQFVNAIKSFKLPEWVPDFLIKFGAFAMPWTEAICAVLLILGLFTRAAAVVTGLMLAFFTAAVASAIVRGLNMEHCGCFGERGLFCTGGPSPCHLAENGFMLAACVIIIATRRHVLAADRLLK